MLCRCLGHTYLCRAFQREESQPSMTRTTGITLLPRAGLELVLPCFVPVIQVLQLAGSLRSISFEARCGMDARYHKYLFW